MTNLSQFYPSSFNQNSFVYTTGNQRISGNKDFANRPTVNGMPVVLYGEFCPGDNNGGGGGSVSISGDVVYITGNQLIFDEKRFDNATNLEGARFLASGEGKYLEKYFYANLSSDNLEYDSPENANSIIFVNISESNIYSVYLPNTEHANESDYLKFVFESTPIPSGNFDQWYDSGDADMLPASGNAGWDNYYAPGLQVNFYSNDFDLVVDNETSVFELISFSPVTNDSISFLFRDGNWIIADEKRNNEIPYHTHEIEDIIGLSDVNGNYIHLEQIYNHTFEDGLDILYNAPYERNSYVNLTFNTSSPCYVDLAHPTGDVTNGDRIILNVKTIAEQSERLIIRHTPFDGNGNYLPYTNLYSLPIPNVNDALEFWYQSPEWTLKSSPGGNNVGGSGSFGGGGSGCCSTIPFVGNRVIKRIDWPLNFNPQAGDVTTFLNKVFYPFTAASINLNSYDLKELGTTFSNVRYVGNIVQNDEVPNGITSLQFLRNGSVIHTIANPTFGSFDYQSSVSLNTNSTLAVRVNINNDGSPTQIIASQAVDFEAPMYFGAGAPGLEEAQIKSVLTERLERRSTKTITFDGINNQKLYIVVPIGWGLFISIRDPSNFENLAGWSSRIREFTLENGVTKQNYYIWETNSLVFNVNDYDLNFIF